MSGENKKSNRFFLHKNRLQTCINNLQIVLTQQIYEKKQSVVAGLERFRWLATSKQNDEMCAILYADTRVWCPGESVFPTVYTGPTSETNFSGRSFQPDRGPDRTEIFVQYPAHRLKRESGCRSPAGRHPQSAG